MPTRGVPLPEGSCDDLLVSVEADVRCPWVGSVAVRIAMPLHLSLRRGRMERQHPDGSGTFSLVPLHTLPLR